MCVSQTQTVENRSFLSGFERQLEKSAVHISSNVRRQSNLTDVSALGPVLCAQPAALPLLLYCIYFAQNHKANILLHTQIEMVNRVAGARKHSGYHNEYTNACPELGVNRSKI
jgi:hypothetical protein